MRSWPRACVAPAAANLINANTSVKGGYTERIYSTIPNNKAGGRCKAPAIISQAKLDPYVEALALEEIGRLALSAKERTNAVEAATAAVDAAEAELVAYERVTQVTAVSEDAFVEGRRIRQEAVEAARAKAAEARSAPRAGPESSRVSASSGRTCLLTIVDTFYAAPSVRCGSVAAMGPVRTVFGSWPPAMGRRSWPPVSG